MSENCEQFVSNTNKINENGGRVERSRRTQSTIRVCRFYAANKCKYGERCAFTHVNVVDRLRDDDEEMRQLSTESETGQRPVVCTPEGGQPMPPRSSDTSATTVACRFFVKTGKCRNGLTCRFLHPSPVETSRPDPVQPVCKFFGKAQKCRNGEACRFLHVPISQPLAADKSEQGSNSDVAAVAQSWRACRHFKAGACAAGNKCRFRHVLTPQVSATESVLTTKRPSATSTKVRPAAIQPLERRLDQMTDEDIRGLRRTEIEQLKRRFTKCITYPGADDDGYGFTFIPTDPDWPYDVREVQLVVTFPSLYPKQMMAVEVVKDQPLPLTVQRHVQCAVDTWLAEKSSQLKRSQTVRLVFRPFLKWLDKSLEETFTDGLMEYKRELVAKAAGLQFIHPPSSRPAATATAGALCGETAPQQLVGKRSDDANARGGDAEHEEVAETTSTPATDTTLTVAMETMPTRRGTEVKLDHLSLSQTAATLVAVRVAIAVQCRRCAARLDVTTAATGRVVAVECHRCHAVCRVAFRPAVVHALASVVGYLDLDACSPFDFVLADCHFLLTCLECSRDSTIKGLPAGQQLNVWCQHCHQKMSLAVNSVRFLQLQPSVMKGTHKIHHVKPVSLSKVEVKDISYSTKVRTERTSKTTAATIPFSAIKGYVYEAEADTVVPVKKGAAKVKDAAMVVGHALPASGACRHYKKSFRWLRFPCCGKLYPCDVCHDEHEEHEMKYANRMVCGHCSTEQPFANEKPCVACEAHMTKKSGAFWEGGKGCRDKIKMSRNDDRKFSNINKTVSRRSQAAKDKTRQKKTKKQD